MRGRMEFSYVYIYIHTHEMVYGILIFGDVACGGVACNTINGSPERSVELFCVCYVSLYLSRL